MNDIYYWFLITTLCVCFLGDRGIIACFALFSIFALILELAVYLFK